MTLPLPFDRCVCGAPFACGDGFCAACADALQDAGTADWHAALKRATGRGAICIYLPLWARP